MKMFHSTLFIKKQFYLLMWFKKSRIETPFKGDNVKALIKTSNCEKLVLYFSEKSQKIAAFAMLFWFSVTKQLLKNIFGFPQWSEISMLSLVLKLNFTLAWPLRLVIPYFCKWKFLSDDRCFYLHDSKWNLRSDVDGFNHTKQLLNLLCIVYFFR